MIKLTDMPRRIKLELELTEEDVVELYTMVAIFAKSKLAYEIGDAFERAGYNFDVDLLEKPDTEVYFKTRRFD